MTTATLDNVDVLIVGAGPVGLFGAYYAGVRTLSTAVLDSLEEPGGQITAMYPEKAIFDVAGFPAIKGRELVEQLLEQREVRRPRLVLDREHLGVVTAALCVGLALRERALERRVGEVLQQQRDLAGVERRPQHGPTRCAETPAAPAI